MAWPTKSFTEASWPIPLTTISYDQTDDEKAASALNRLTADPPPPYVGVTIIAERIIINGREYAMDDYCGGWVDTKARIP